MDILMYFLGLIVGTENVEPADVIVFEARHLHLEPKQIPAGAEIGEAWGLGHVEAAVAACESGHRLQDGSAEPGTHDWKAENPSPSSSASGAFQFVDGTWRWVWSDLIGQDPPTTRAMDASPAAQIEAFRALWREGRGSHHWEASQRCWAKTLSS